MGSLNPENEPKPELNDSEYVQDYSAPRETSSNEVPVKSAINLLDLSDDVLLYILKYCSPRDLKALGYTCSRLGTLVLDRTLWQTVDARDFPTGKHRMRWYLSHALSAYTTRLRLSGFAREAKGCLGFMSGSRDDTPLQAGPVAGMFEGSDPFTITASASPGDCNGGPGLMLWSQALPRYGGGFPFWPERPPHASATYRPRAAPAPAPEHTGQRCPGPQVTLTNAALKRLTALCTNLTELALEYVIIDCNMTNICMFPKSLRKLSLRGTKCFNLEKSFLYKIQDHLVLLEDLDVSYCEWIEPACMLPLSKMPCLARLVMQHCPKLSEFVAYASLATRYGFKTLKILDLRGCPVGDSEVSALGWVPRLEQLYLAPAPPQPRHADHAHFNREPSPRFRELSAWEEQEPEYYKSKYASEPWILEEQKRRPTRNNPSDDNAIGSCVLVHHVTQPQFPPPQDYVQPQIQNRPFHIERILAEQTRELERERKDVRANATMGYVLSNNGCRRTINMYPDTEMEPENSGNATANNQDASNKRKQENADGSGPSKRHRDMSNEPGSSTQARSVNEPGSSTKVISVNESGASTNVIYVNEPGASTKVISMNEPGSSTKVISVNEPGSSAKVISMNEPGSSKEPCATKASRKYYDDADCQVSRTVLKDSLSDFRKRTQDFDGPVLKPHRDDSSKPDFVDSDDENDPATMDDDDDGTDDDNDDDDASQPKRRRVVINEGASTSKSESKIDYSQPSTSKNSTDQPSQSTQPSCSTQPGSTKPSQSSVQSHFNIALHHFGNEDLGLSVSSSLTEFTDNMHQMTKFISLNDHSPSAPLEVPNINEPGHASFLNDQPGHASYLNDEPGHSSKESNLTQKFVRFRHNEPADVIEGCAAGCSALNNNFNNNNVCNNNYSQEVDWNNGYVTQRDPMISGVPESPEEQLEFDPRITNGDAAAPESATPDAGSAATGSATASSAEPNIPQENASNHEPRRHRILYVNVGRRRHAMYQISMPEPVDLRTQRASAAHMNLIYSSHLAPRLEHTSLVSDSAIRRFGRADNENINYVQIGPMGPIPAPFEDPHARPNRSNLRVLSVTGYTQISNNSLNHLLTAAPHLQLIDFRGTRVTGTAVEHFRNFRPDCVVRYGPYWKPTEDDTRPPSH